MLAKKPIFIKIIGMGDIHIFSARMKYESMIITIIQFNSINCQTQKN